MIHATPKARVGKYSWILLGLAAIGILYAWYISGLSVNPPGFYVDESCLSYNGYLIAHTGVSESGANYPLYVQCYTGFYIQYANPMPVYLLAILYSFVPAGILAARVYAATFVFISTLLLGLLATRMSGRKEVGVCVAVSAMLTPWLFEASRLVLETFTYPLL